jgi:hypothetical protein
LKSYKTLRKTPKIEEFTLISGGLGGDKMPILSTAAIFFDGTKLQLVLIYPIAYFLCQNAHEKRRIGANDAAQNIGLKLSNEQQIITNNILSPPSVFRQFTNFDF